MNFQCRSITEQIYSISGKRQREGDSKQKSNKRLKISDENYDLNIQKPCQLCIDKQDIINDLCQKVKKDKERLKSYHIKVRKLRNQNSLLIARVRLDNDKYVKHTKFGNNTKIYCRIRQNAHCSRQCVQISGQQLYLKQGFFQQTFKFDKILANAQIDCFRQLQPEIQSALLGFNLTTICIGQPNSGKTFTLLGEVQPLKCDKIGIIPRAIDFIFQLFTSNGNYFNPQCFIQIVGIDQGIFNIADQTQVFNTSEAVLLLQQQISQYDYLIYQIYVKYINLQGQEKEVYLNFIEVNSDSIYRSAFLSIDQQEQPTSAQHFRKFLQSFRQGYIDSNFFESTLLGAILQGSIDLSNTQINLIANIDSDYEKASEARETLTFTEDFISNQLNIYVNTQNQSGDYPDFLIHF